MTSQRESAKPDYSQLSEATLQGLLESIKSKLILLETEFGGWSGYEWAERRLRMNPDLKDWDEAEMPDHICEVRRLESERQRIALELSKRAPTRPRPGVPDAPNLCAGRSADEWQDFHSKFMQLANQEDRIDRSAGKDRLLRAYCDYKQHPEVWERGKPNQGLFSLLDTPPHGIWIYSDGLDENFLARFRVLAARGGLALGSPQDTDPEDFWLHRLFLDLVENNSDELFAASKEGGMIRRVCVASATFCSRLERKALEQSEPGADRKTDRMAGSHAQKSDKTAQSLEDRSNVQRRKLERRNPEVAKRTVLVRSNLNAPTEEMCEIFDRENVPVPAKWLDAGFQKWSRAYKDPIYRAKIDVLVSKARRKD
jgi:hypothetical protein